jgi:chitinase
VQDFGNKCWGTDIYNRCPEVQEDIPYCQSIGKKIILSLGGGSSGYQLTGDAAGTAFGNALWKAYGPIQPGYTGPRPLDRGLYNTSMETTIDIDGFDFDIEHTTTGSFLKQSWI